MSDRINERLNQLVESVRAIDFDQIMETVYSRKDVEENVIFLNTENQLRKGLNAKGGVLGLYRSFTYSSLKQNVAGRKAGFGVVDLFLTGDYYNTFVEDAKKDHFIIDSNPIKDGENLMDKYEDSEGLTDDSLKKHFIFILPIIRNELVEAILQ